MDSGHARQVSPPFQTAVDRPGMPCSQLEAIPTATHNTSSRHSRLLQTRNARFAGTRLSVSGLDSRSIPAIHRRSSIQHPDENTPPRGQAASPKLRRNSSSPSLSVFDEKSNAARSRLLSKGGGIPIYHDTDADDTETQPNPSLPAIYNEIFRDLRSPLEGSGRLAGSDKMRLREVSGNEHRGGSSPLTYSSLKDIKKWKSGYSKTAFDTQDYIDHMERELQLAKDAMYSPTTKKSLKEQLRSARSENSRLKHEVASLRDTFEGEVKKTVEHKTAVEVELKRTIRGLEEELGQKESKIQELECKHEDKRLDSNTIDTLKAAIERLEQEKMAMVDENRSISKRNEVLSELLAMSPTKTQGIVELRSPIRERRGGRPMSMIIPRLPSSPSPCSTRSNPTSVVGSPHLHAATHFMTLQMGSPPSLYGPHSQDIPRSNPDICGERRAQDGPARRNDSRRSTLQSETSTVSNPGSMPSVSSPTGESFARPIMKRKPRKFMSGSTQLKPLLLPALTTDSNSQFSASILTSPRSAASRDFSQDSCEVEGYFLTHPDLFASENVQTGDTNAAYAHAATESTRIGDRHQTFEAVFVEANVPKSETDIALQKPCLSSSPLGSAETPDTSGYEQRPEPHASHRGCITNSSQALDPNDYDAILNSSNCASSEVFPFALDLQALSDLKLPSPRYEDYPEPVVGMDQQCLLDVPEPLFSPGRRSRGPDNIGRALVPAIVHSADTSDNVAIPRKRTFSITSMRGDRTPPLLKPYGVWPSSPGLGILSPYSPSPFSSATRSLRTPLKKSPSLDTSQFLARSPSPLDLLQEWHFGARPLAAITIRTIFGTISKCTAYIRDFKHDPLTLARRVLVSAWFAQWNRVGKMSWWVLGLFLPQIKKQPESTWNLEQYDGEEFARLHCEDQHAQEDFHDRGLEDNTIHCIDFVQEASPQQESQDDVNTNDGWGSSLYLWGKFSVAIMLAVGDAVVKGPGEALKEIDRTRHHQQQTRERSRKSTETYHEHCPPSIVHRFEGMGSIFDSSPVSGFTFRSRRQLFADDPTGLQQHDDQEGTLRPPKAMKTHVAHIFGENHSESGVPREDKGSILQARNRPPYRPPSHGRNNDHHDFDLPPGADPVSTYDSVSRTP